MEMRANFVLVGTDMVERKHIMNSVGFRGKNYCEYCKITGVSRNGIYCPHLPPHNAPESIKEREMKLRENDQPYYKFRDRHKHPCQLKTNAGWRKVLEYVRTHPEDMEFARSYGIKGPTVLGDLPGIIFPWSFPPDAMHLLYENVLVLVINHMDFFVFVGVNILK